MSNRPTLSVVVTHRYWQGALLLVLLGVAFQRLRQAYPPLDAPLNSDAFWTYLPNARKLLQAPWSFLTTDPASYHVAPLGYMWPALLGADQALIQTANGALFLVSCVLLWDFVRRLGGSLAAFVATGLLIGHPDLINHAPLVLTESVYLFGLMLALYGALRAALAPSGTSAGWLGLLTLGLTITLLSRPVLQYMLAAALVLLFVVANFRLPRLRLDRQQARGFFYALAAALLLPLAFAAKNAVYFDVWGIGTGSGTGLYYGVSPFKNGSEPVYSNFSYDAGVTPWAVMPEIGNQPLDRRADTINRTVALELVKRTTLADNLAFFGLKLKGWLFTATPELHIDSRWRRIRVFEWLTIAAFSAALLYRARRGTPVALPGQPVGQGVKLGVYYLLLLIVLGMAAQLVPVLYNMRYASYFIEPWLMMLTGLSIGYLVQGDVLLRGRRRWQNWALSSAVLVLLGFLAHHATQYALRHEAWRLDPYRPGPTAVMLPSALFSPPRGDGMALVTDPASGREVWRFTASPATLHIDVDTRGAPDVSPDRARDAMWRFRFGLVPAPDHLSRCLKVDVAVAPHHEAISWYVPPAWLPAQAGAQPRTYLIAGNGALRPQGQARVSLTFHCPVGSLIDWRGQELLGSTLPLAARALIREGTPIDPYRRSEP